MKAISVENVSKKFILRHDRAMNLADGLKSVFFRTQKEDFWAVKDANFSVEQGEAVGIIGHNGAGKSTMFKLLTKIMDPTEGIIRTRGRISALIEVGAGFHPEMSGRENIFLNGSILGMSRQEIGRKLDDIIAFAELENFIDMPVKRYSSGMYARLGFAVLAHLEPEILLVDEVLSVGDERFQLKCQERMSSLIQGGVTVLFISHNLPAVMSLCKETIVMDHGRIIDRGDSHAMVRLFRRLLAGTSDDSGDKEIDGVGPLTIKRIRVLDAEGNEVEMVGALENVDVVADVTVRETVKDANIGFEIYRADGLQVYAQTSAADNYLPILEPGEHELRFSIEELPLVEGTYSISLGIMDPTEVIHYSTLRRGAYFTVTTDRVYRGVSFIKHGWNTRNVETL